MPTPFRLRQRINDKFRDAPSSPPPALPNLSGENAQVLPSEDGGFSSISRESTLQPLSSSATDFHVGRIGLFEIISPDASSQNVEVDVVAVHGLMGDPFKTWTKNGNLWLRDFLPSQLPSARIFTYGYNSTVAFSQSVAGIDDFARNLLTRLDLERASEEEQNRPILFIGHSLGGIVIKKALIIAHEEAPSNYAGILESVRAVAFLGVPHSGAAIARLGDYFAKALNKATLGRITNTSLITDLRRGSKTLRDVSSQSVHRLSDLRILSFFEREKTLGELIVDEPSARLHIHGERAIPVDANHQEICRFGSDKDQNYLLVSRSIARLAREVISIEKVKNVQRDVSLPEPPKLVQELTDKEEACVQCFYTIDSKGLKRRIAEHVDGTCEWVTRDSRFKYWLTEPGSDLLWISGPPGCGKSVMASWLIDMMSRLKPDSTVVYFFCDDKIAAQRSAKTLLRSVIHQLLEVYPSLVKHAMPHFRSKGRKLVEELSVLWDIMVACLDDPTLPEVTYILDGLDECERAGQEPLLRLLKQYFEPSTKGPNKVKCLFTSRPDEFIADIMEGLPNFRLPLEVASTAKHMNDDINLVIKNRIDNMRSLKSWDRNRKDALIEQLVGNADRTFLWIMIVLQSISNAEDTSSKAFAHYISSLPDALDQMYSNILENIPPHRRDKAKTMLELLVAAQRALSLGEVNFAWSVGPHHGTLRSLHEDLQSDLTRMIHSLCGQFVRILDGWCYLIHSTAKDFLLKTKANESFDTNDWYSIDLDHANLVLTERCMWYLCLDFQTPLDYLVPVDLKDFLGLAKDTTYLSRDFPPLSWLRYRLSQYIGRFTFLSYAIEWWVHHFREAYICETSWRAEFVGLAKQIYSSELIQLHWWISTEWFRDSKRDISTSFPFPVMSICAFNGHRAVVQSLLEEGHNLNHQLSTFGFTALHLAILGKQHEMTQWLINEDANLESEDFDQETPILTAAYQDDVDVLECLLQNGANTEIASIWGDTPLLRSIQHSSISQVKLLLDYGAHIDTTNHSAESALHIAVSAQDFAKVKLLIDLGANVNIIDNQGRTPLHEAIETGAVEIAKCLLAVGAATDIQDRSNRTPLEIAFTRHDFVATELLLDNGATPDDHNLPALPTEMDAEDISPEEAVESDDHKISMLVRHYKTSSTTTTIYPSSTLYLAAEAGDVEQVSSILESGGYANSRNGERALTPLEIATRKRNGEVIETLLRHNAVIKHHVTRGPSSLAYAIKQRQSNTTRLLLQHGANLLSPVCCSKHLPLAIALRTKDEEILRMLPVFLGEVNPPLKEEVQSLFETLVDQCLAYIVPNPEGMDGGRVFSGHKVSTNAAIYETSTSSSGFSECDADTVVQETEDLATSVGNLEQPSAKVAFPTVSSLGDSLPLTETTLVQHNEATSTDFSLLKRWINYDEWSKSGTNALSMSSCRADKSIADVKDEAAKQDALDELSKAMSTASTEANSTSNSRAGSVRGHANDGAQATRQPHSPHTVPHSKKFYEYSPPPMKQRARSPAYTPYTRNRPGSMGSWASSGGSDTSFRARYDIYSSPRPKSGTRPSSRQSDPELGKNNMYYTAYNNPGLRACDNCRKTKKRCNVIKGKCSHCARGGLPCVRSVASPKQPTQGYGYVSDDYIPTRKTSEATFNRGYDGSQHYNASSSHANTNHSKKSYTYYVEDSYYSEDAPTRQSGSQHYNARSSRNYTNYAKKPKSYYTEGPYHAWETPTGSHTRRATMSKIKGKKPAKTVKEQPKATEADADRHEIPKGYSLKNWDPTEEPILLLGSVFDANSLGKWIYDWTAHHHGAGSPMTEFAGELWLLLIQFAAKIKRAEEAMPRVTRSDNRELLEDFVESGNRIWTKLKKSLKIGEDSMIRTARNRSGRKNSQLNAASGIAFVETLFGREKELDNTEKLMAHIRIWNMRFDANCEEIVRHPSA